MFKATTKQAMARVRSPVLYAVLVAAIATVVALACGVESGERRSARPTPVTEFHRTPVTALEPTFVNLKKTSSGCEAEPADLQLDRNRRVRLSIQLDPSAEQIQVTYAIPGLEISSPGGAVTFLGAREVEVTINPGPRTNFDFNITNNGQFDIMCDGAKVGTLTVTGG